MDMENMELIDFIASAIEAVGWLNDLARRTKNGFFPASICKPENKTQWEDAIVYVDEPDDRLPGIGCDEIVADTECLAEGRGGIRSYREILSELCDSEVPVSVEHHEADEFNETPYKLVRLFFESDANPTICLDIVVDADGWRIN